MVLLQFVMKISKTSNPNYATPFVKLPDTVLKFLIQGNETSKIIIV